MWFPGLDGFVPGYGRHRPCDWGLGFEIRGHKSPHWTAPSASPETFGHFGQSGTFLWIDRWHRTPASSSPTVPSVRGPNAVEQFQRDLYPNLAWIGTETPDPRGSLNRRPGGPRPFLDNDSATTKVSVARYEFPTTAELLEMGEPREECGDRLPTGDSWRFQLAGPRSKLNGRGHPHAARSRGESRAPKRPLRPGLRRSSPMSAGTSCRGRWRSSPPTRRPRSLCFRTIWSTRSR